MKKRPLMISLTFLFLLQSRGPLQALQSDRCTNFETQQLPLFKERSPDKQDTASDILYTCAGFKAADVLKMIENLSKTPGSTSDFQTLKRGIANGQPMHLVCQPSGMPLKDACDSVLVALLLENKWGRLIQMLPGKIHDIVRMDDGTSTAFIGPSMGLHTQISYYDANSREIRREFFEQGNGSPQLKRRFFYDAAKQDRNTLCISHGEHDQNGNGRLDKWEYYENCKLVRVELDENENGTKETIQYYDPKSGDYPIRTFTIGAENTSKAAAAVDAKNYQLAIATYQAANQELLKEWGADSGQVCDNLNEIGKTHTAAKQYPQAMGVFRQALGLQQCGKYTRDRVALGLLWTVAYTEDHQRIVSTGTEVAHLYAAAHQGRKDADIEGLLGYGYLRLKNYQAAYEHSRAAIELELANAKESCSGTAECFYFNPWHFSIFGEACSFLGRISESTSFINQALAFRSRLPSAQVDSFEFSLAYESYVAGDPNNAITLNDRFLRDEQRRAPALCNHALFYLALGDSKKASQLIKDAVSAGLKKEDWAGDLDLFKKYYPGRAPLIPALLKASGQYP